MNKQGKKRMSMIFAVSVIVLLAIGIFATVSGVDENDVDDGSNKEGSIVSSDNGEKDVEEVTKDYIEKFAEKRKVEKEKINNISEVDFNSLPKEVNIENVDDTNLAIYEVEYNETKKSGADEGKEEKRKLFVITYSTEKLKKQGDLIIAHDKRQFLSFGLSGGKVGSSFLKTSTNVETSFEKGYVMMREGSITAMSTNMEIMNALGEDVEIIIYKNGEPIRFGNSLDASSKGVKKDYDVQSNDVVKFEPGDTISVYVDAGKSIAWKDAIVMVEITTK